MFSSGGKSSSKSSEVDIFKSIKNKYNPCQDPEEALEEAIMVLINLAPDQEDDALDYLHHKEKQLTIRGTTYA